MKRLKTAIAAAALLIISACGSVPEARTEQETEIKEAVEAEKSGFSAAPVEFAAKPKNAAISKNLTTQAERYEAAESAGTVEEIETEQEKPLPVVDQPEQVTEETEKVMQEPEETKTEQKTESPVLDAEIAENSANIEDKTEKIESTEPEEPKTEDSGDIIGSWEGWDLHYFNTYNVTSNRITKKNGVVRYNGHRETWYSTREAAGKTTARSIPGKHTAQDGTIRDENGFVCVASSDLAFYSTLLTTAGPAKVYDTGCSSGTIDIYTNW